MWTLSRHWYGDRLEPTFTPRSIDAAQQLLNDIGLTADFWQLTPRPTTAESLDS